MAEGLFDLGIAGRDWVEETASDVVILGELQLLEGLRAGRSGSCSPCRSDSPVETVADLPAGRAGVDASTPS